VASLLGGVILASGCGLQLAMGAVNGRQLVAASALAETHRGPQFTAKPLGTPAVDLAGLYGLGHWNISPPIKEAAQLGHSGAFNLRAPPQPSTWLPQQSLGIVVLSTALDRRCPNHFRPHLPRLATLGHSLASMYFP